VKGAKREGRGKIGGKREKLPVSRKKGTFTEEKSLAVQSL